jgi:RND family efflux transporter MFP subunit
MKNSAYSVVALALIAGAFVAGAWYDQRDAVGAAGLHGRRVLYYVDPMHPSYRSDKPGVAPDCGMALEPIYSDGAPADVSVPQVATPSNVIAISAEKQQLIGVRVSTVEETAATQTLRFFGRVAPSETRVYTLNAGVDGFIREASPVTTGAHVKKDQWLATYSAPELRQPSQAYIVTLGILDRSGQPGEDSPAQLKATGGASQLAVDKLMNLGMSAIQIDEIKRTRESPVNIRILAPAAGFVLARNVSPGQKFERGTEWYRVADLSQVWILTDVFENDAQYVRPGTRVRVSVPAQQQTLPARVAAVLPQFDVATRTLKIRLEAENPDYILRPDMFVDVELAIALPRTITVPVDAVVDSGLTKTVFVERGDGLFQPRQVETGPRLGNRVAIEKGLTPGERIVVSGTFLLDSDTRMRSLSAARQP